MSLGSVLTTAIGLVLVYGLLGVLDSGVIKSASADAKPSCIKTELFVQSLVGAYRLARHRCRGVVRILVLVRRAWDGARSARGGNQAGAFDEPRQQTAIRGAS
jgi:hypothetical protein